MTHFKLRALLGTSSCLLLFAIACSDDDDNVMLLDNEAGAAGSETASAGSGGGNSTAGTGGSSDSGGSAGSGGSSGSGGGSGGTDTAGPVEVSGEIASDTTWTADNTYVLTNLTYVAGGSTLTIEPGTVVQGREGSALVVTAGSRLVAEGTAEEPIVLTSAVAEGGRAPGDWGGVVLLGNAPINLPGGTNQIEGIDPTEDRGTYGGTDAAHDCGSLRYVRIEFAGFELSVDNELNGLTVGGCGSETSLEYIQVHRGSDDGIEFFGGNVDLKYAVTSNIQDDSVDWDQGYSGRIQFLAVRHDPAGSDAGFEADNLAEDNDATPRSQPTIYNVTMVGGEGSASPAMVLRRGTWGTISNAIVTGFPGGALDIRDGASIAGAEAEPATLVVQNSLFFQNGMGGTAHGGSDEAFDELAFLGTDGLGNVLDVDPELTEPAATVPNLVPAAESPVATGGATPPDDGFFDTTATYIGAFEPGGDDWTDGWTAYPEN